MTELVSKQTVIDTIAIIDLDRKDLEAANYGSQFAERIKSEQATGAVVNLASFQYITSDDIGCLHHLVAVLEVAGIQTCVCGINSASAALIYNFVDTVRFTTALDTQSAIDELKNR